MQDKKDIENVVQEIMGLIRSMSDADFRAGQCTGRTDFAGAAKHEGDSSAIERAIASKLRELVENSFSVLEPLGYKGGLQSDDKVTLFFDNTECASTWFESFTDSVDIHNIINTEKKGV